jgi:diguanylate cyclase (GGDEF)-like protein/PAS domain S-box-containing protein
MRLIIATGVALFIVSVARLPMAELGLPYALLSIVTIAVGSRILVRFFRFDSCISISDIFIFLAMLLFDGEAAIVLGGVESFFASFRVTKKWKTMVFNGAAMVCSAFVTVWVMRFCFGSIVETVRGDYSSRLVVMTCAMALVQYIVNSGIVAVAGALKTNQPVLTTYKKHYVWTSITYLAGASSASITAKLIGVVGFYAFMATIPIIVIVYFTYITYVKNVESSVLQAEQAQKHLAEMQKSEERFRSAFDLAPIGMALVAPDGRWLQVNQSLCDILGYTEVEFKGMNFQAITHPEDISNSLTKINQVLAGSLLTCQIEKRYLHKQGHEVCVLTGVSLIQDSESKSSHLIFQIQDITDRKRAEQQLVHDAFHDALTGLPNRARFMEQLEASIKEATRNNEHIFAVLFLDLDRFKIINDSIGHMVGDQLLIGISQRLLKNLRVGDKVARLGGDEFTILLNNIKDATDAIEIADRILKQVAQPFNLGGYETFTTASIGIALFSPDYAQPEDLLRDADTAMYQAKSLGKARYVIFDKGMHVHAMNLLKLETDLRRAIDRKEFFVMYQPIVSLETGRLSGFEALVRWQHPERGLIYPSEFIAVAEETGFIVSIGQWMLLESCRQMRRWQEKLSDDQPLSISVNLSSKQFAHSDLLDQIMRTLDVTGLDPHSLKLEITESIVMQNIDVATGMLEQLRALGVELSIDDFGTGYSSLSYLHRLPIDTLKIDRSFVSHIVESNENKEIVRTIIMLAQNLGMGVIAEGVETRGQVELLRELNCQSGQGYLFAKPLDADSATVLIERMAQNHEISDDLKDIFESKTIEPLASAYQM